MEKRGQKKEVAGTQLTTEQFKTHFEKVSHQRFENRPEEVERVVEKAEDLRGTRKAEEWAEKLDEVPTMEEMLREMALMRDSAPGEDGV